jgi:hypothetical protein
MPADHPTTACTRHQGRAMPLAFMASARPDPQTRQTHAAYAARAPPTTPLAPGTSRRRQRGERLQGHPERRCLASLRLRARARLERSGVEVALGAWQMIVALLLGHLLCSAHRPAIEVHQAAVWRRVGKNHTAAAPIARRVRPLFFASV